MVGSPYLLDGNLIPRMTPILPPYFEAARTPQELWPDATIVDASTAGIHVDHWSKPLTAENHEDEQTRRIHATVHMFMHHVIDQGSMRRISNLAITSGSVTYDLHVKEYEKYAQMGRTRTIGLPTADNRPPSWTNLEHQDRFFVTNTAHKVMACDYAVQLGNMQREYHRARVGMLTSHDANEHQELAEKMSLLNREIERMSETWYKSVIEKIEWLGEQISSGDLTKPKKLKYEPYRTQLEVYLESIKNNPKIDLNATSTDDAGATTDTPNETYYFEMTREKQYRFWELQFKSSADIRCNFYAFYAKTIALEECYKDKHMRDLMTYTFVVCAITAWKFYCAPIIENVELSRSLDPLLIDVAFPVETKEVARAYKKAASDMRQRDGFPTTVGGIKVPSIISELTGRGRTKKEEGRKRKFRFVDDEDEGDEE